MSAWTACFPFLSLISCLASSPTPASYFSFSLKCCRVIGRRFERPQYQIDGRWGACPWHTGLRRSIERAPLCPHPSSPSPNHPVMENVQDGGGESSGWQTCLSVAQRKQLRSLWATSFSSLILPEEVHWLSPQLKVLKSYQDVKWSELRSSGFFLVLFVLRYVIISILFNKTAAKSAPRTACDEEFIVGNCGPHDLQDPEDPPPVSQHHRTPSEVQVFGGPGQYLAVFAVWQTALSCRRRPRPSGNSWALRGCVWSVTVFWLCLDLMCRHSHINSCTDGTTNGSNLGFSVLNKDILTYSLSHFGGSFIFAQEHSSSRYRQSIPHKHPQTSFFTCGLENQIVKLEGTWRAHTSAKQSVFQCFFF